MRTILTIDFDIIMDSYSELYGNKEGMPWEKKLEIFPGLREMPINSFHYEKVTNLILLMSKFLAKENIHFIKDHHSICKFLNPTEKYNIINIDHHHDWYYKEPYSFNKHNLNCGNWMNYCYNNKMVNSYTWINNNTSMPPPEDINTINFKTYELINYNILSTPQIDEIFLCFSPEFVPPYHHPLFFIWMNIYSSCYKNHFEFED